MDWTQEFGTLESVPPSQFLRWPLRRSPSLTAFVRRHATEPRRRRALTALAYVSFDRHDDTNIDSIERAHRIAWRHNRDFSMAAERVLADRLVSSGGLAEPGRSFALAELRKWIRSALRRVPWLNPSSDADEEAAVLAVLVLGDLCRRPRFDRPWIDNLVERFRLREQTILRKATQSWLGAWLAPPRRSRFPPVQESSGPLEGFLRWASGVQHLQRARVDLVRSSWLGWRLLSESIRCRPVVRCQACGSVVDNETSNSCSQCGELLTVTQATYWLFPPDGFRQAPRPAVGCRGPNCAPLAGALDRGVSRGLIYPFFPEDSLCPRGCLPDEQHRTRGRNYFLSAARFSSDSLRSGECNGAFDRDDARAVFRRLSEVEARAGPRPSLEDLAQVLYGRTERTLKSDVRRRLASERRAVGAGSHEDPARISLGRV